MRPVSVAPKTFKVRPIFFISVGTQFPWSFLFMRVLITGSHGLVGSALSEACLRAGHEVTPFDIVRPGAEQVEDICDGAALAEQMAGCDGVIHLAAISRVAWGEDRPDLCLRVNVEGTRNVTEAALAQPHGPWLIFASSREVYGNPPSSLVTEDDPIAPVNTYGRSKAEGERIIEQARTGGLATAIVRLSNVYGGRRDHPDRAVPALLTRALAGEALVVTGGDNYFDFVHVDDCVTGLLATAGLLAAGERALPPIQLTTGTATSLRRLAQLSIAMSGSDSQIIEAPARPFDVSGFCGDPARARDLLGWRAEIDLQTGLARLADDLRRNGPLDPVDMPDPEAPRRD